MPFKDVREFIARLEKVGEAQRIGEEVDWNLEVGAMVRKACEQGLPAPFFQKIKGYPEGYSMLGAPLGKLSRIAVAMDMDPNVHPKELVEEYLARKRQPIKPVLVNDGPCKENIHLGDEIDLLEFPVPMVSDGDGGRYIGTFHLTITKDSDSDWVNWGMYRHMLHDKNTIGIQAGPPTHIMRMRQGYAAGNKLMEVAVAIGVEPISTFCAGSVMPYGVSEVDVVGGIRGEPVELVKCETVDLAVPATAEIVIEGEMRPGETMDEGPFGEYTGYRAGFMEPRPVIHVKAVTHRSNPIFTMTCAGVPVDDDHTIAFVSKAAGYLELLRAQGLPVTGVSGFPELTSMVIVVAIKAGQARADDVAHAIWASRGGVSTPWVIVVEDDVDPFNMAQVFHALVTKCHPYRGIVRLEHSRGMALIPWLNQHEQKYLLGARAYFDCTWPPDWEPSEVPKKCSFEKIYPLEVQQKASAKWRKHGF